jgi:MFS family permease
MLELDSEHRGEGEMKQTAGRLAHVTLVVLFSANFVNFMDRQVVAALAPSLKAYWQLTDVQVGLLGTAFEILYALGHVPLALLSDRWLRRKVISLAAAVWSGAMAVTGAARSYGMVLLGRAALGVGEAGYGPSALAWLSDLFPPERRSRVVGVHDLGVMLGSAAGYVIGGVLGTALGWRSVFTLTALPGFALAVLIWFLPEPEKGQSDYGAWDIDPGRASRPAVLSAAAARQLLSVPTMLVTYVVGALNTFAIAGTVYWLPSYAVRLHGFAEDTFGLLTGVLTVVAGATGVLSGAFLADRLLRRTAAGRLLTISIGVLIGSVLAMAAIFVSDRLLFVVLSAAAMIAFALYLPCIAPLLHQVSLPGNRATAMGVYLLVVHTFGNGPAPALIGWLSDQTGDLRLAVLAAPLMALIGGLIGLWGTRFVEQDAEAMRAQL